MSNFASAVALQNGEDVLVNSLAESNQVATPQAKVASPQTKVEKLDEVLMKSPNPGTGDKKPFSPIELRKATKDRIDGAKATLNTSSYVTVGIKRDERAGIEELQKAFDHLANEYKSLYAEYDVVYRAYSELYESASDASQEFHDQQQLSALKFDLIHRILNARDSSGLEQAIQSTQVTSLAVQFERECVVKAENASTVQDE